MQSAETSEHDRLLDRLEREIRDLRIEYEKFFNGALEVPPEEMRSRVENGLRVLRNSSSKSVAAAFRLSNLEARFASYRELYGRRLRAHEEGRGHDRRAAAAQSVRHDPTRGIVFGTSTEPAAVEALYQGIAKGSGQGPRFDLESFRTYLERQATAIRAKTGCTSVQFRIAEESDGRLKLKARPLGGG